LYLMKSAGDAAIVIYTHPLTNFWLLALGGLGGALIRRAPWFKRVLAPLPVVLLLTVCIALLCVQEPGWERADNAMQFTVSYVFYGACISLLVCAVASSARNAFLVRMLEAKPLVSLGRVSYGFYLYHAFIPDFTRSPRINALFGAEGMPWWARGLCIVVAFLLTFGLAKLSWHFIEAPILKLKDRRFVRGKSQRQIESNGARFTESP
uniref:acyltransferase family protein n=1 Tax=Caballeronia sp. BR00000012568055 TaxID=2918761 RepID=UPI0034D6F783